MSLIYLFIFSFCTLPGGQFPCTDDCQVTFVNLKCDSSKKRRRGRKSPAKEVSHITAEFEMEMKEEEASGVAPPGVGPMWLLPCATFVALRL